MDTNNKILGIGNSLMDFLCVLPTDDVISKFGLLRGGMQVVDADFQMQVLGSLSDLKVKRVRGGSVPNTLSGIRNLGLEVGFVGKIGRDETGRFFKGDLLHHGIETNLIESEDLPTGRCLSLVSPDGERTMLSCLGATGNFRADDLLPEMFKGYAICHIDGYLLQNYELIETAMKFAQKAGAMISLDLGSFNVVRDNLDFLKRIVPQYVDVVFANEEEARAYAGVEPEDALDVMAETVKYAVVKVGGKGSWAKHGREKVFVPPLKGVKSIDTTGAGDLYASGFLYGLATGRPVADCGRIGAVVSGNVVQVVGTRMDNDRWNAIRASV